MCNLSGSPLALARSNFATQRAVSAVRRLSLCNVVGLNVRAVGLAHERFEALPLFVAFKRLTSPLTCQAVVSGSARTGDCTTSGSSAQAVRPLMFPADHTRRRMSLTRSAHKANRPVHTCSTFASTRSCAYPGDPSAMQRPTKQRRVADDAARALLHVGNISIAGLQRLLASIAESGPDVVSHSRNRLLDVNHQLFVEHSVTELMPLKSGGDFAWQYLCSCKWLSAMVNRSPSLQELFRAALAKSPCSSVRPWHLVVGFDEFSPGNKLAVDNRRKTMVRSFTFLELGQGAVSSGHGWLTVAVLRTCQIEKIRGGWSACLRRFLERALLGDDGFASSGCPLTVAGEACLLFARPSVILSDGDGLRQAFDWRGASSLKPCLIHHNVFKKVILRFNFEAWTSTFK